MGLATIDPHSQKEPSEIDKIPKFGVNRASFDCTGRNAKYPQTETLRKHMTTLRKHNG